jgi:cytochrome c-type biogenesis protein
MSPIVLYAFATGMVATVNPCGFAMLPAYLSYFLGIDDPSRDSESVVVRAVGVSAMVTAGFVVVFSAIGVVLNVAALPIQENIPWATIVIGVLLAGLGVAMLAGFQPSVALPKLERGGDRRTLWSMFVFGVSYAVASLSCTLPLFLVAVTGVFDSTSFASGMAAFIAYGLGMGLVLTALTVALALARQSLVTRLRNTLRYVNRIAGGLLVLAGMFLVYWGWWELQVLGGNVDAGGPADTLMRWQGSLSSWVSRVGAERIGLLLAAFIAVALGVAALRSRRSQDPPAHAASGSSPGGDHTD